MSHGANPKSRIVAGVAAAVFLTGCGFKITAPSSGAYVTNPVSAEIKWAPDYHANTLKIVVDPSSSNLDVTSQFAIAPVSGGYSATGTLPGLKGGSHTLQVSGELFVWYTKNYANTSSQVPFTVEVKHK